MCVDVLDMTYIFYGECGVFYFILESLYFSGIFILLIWSLTLYFYFLTLDSIDVLILQLLMFVLSMKVLRRG